MGADGGSIPSRQELVGPRDGNKQQEPAPENLQEKFNTCSLSKKPLEYDELVSDYYGNLYNKQAVIEYLLSKTKHIAQLHSLKDIINLAPHIKNGKWVCPLTGKDVVIEYKSTKFACISGCGHVFDLALIKGTCPICSANASHPIVLNASGADLARQKKWFIERKKLRKRLKRKI